MKLSSPNGFKKSGIFYLWNGYCLRNINCYNIYIEEKKEFMLLKGILKFFLNSVSLFSLLKVQYTCVLICYTRMMLSKNVYKQS